MAHIKADSGKIWDYYMILANVKADGDSECEDMIKNLKKIIQQIDYDSQGCEREIFEMKREIEQEQKKKHPNRIKISQCKMQINDLKQHILMMRGKQSTAAAYITEIKLGQQKYSHALGCGMQYVSSFLSVLDSVLGRTGWKSISDAGSEHVGGNLGKSGMYTMEFRGHVVYCNDVTFPITEKNLQLMEQGNAPIGYDGLAVNLHHVLQSDSGNLMELTQTIHKQYDKQLHINKGSGIPSGINRSSFGVMKRAYWKKRAAILRQRGSL